MGLILIKKFKDSTVEDTANAVKGKMKAPSKVKSGNRATALKNTPYGYQHIVTTIVPKKPTPKTRREGMRALPNARKDKLRKQASAVQAEAMILRSKPL